MDRHGDVSGHHFLHDFSSDRYHTKISGSRFTLPDLGPLGGNGLANPRDFESPIACFDIDQNSQWEIIYKSGFLGSSTYSTAQMCLGFLGNCMVAIRNIRHLML